MNNKFIKRVAAVVLGVAVLSTCAFAANSITGESYTEETLNFSYSSAADKVSYIAYAANVGSEGTTATVDAVTYSLGNILAVNQIDDNSAAGSVSNLAIDTAKLGDATHIIIMSGDSEGAYDAVAIATSDFTYAATVDATTENKVTLGGVEYTDVPTFKLTITPNKDGQVTVSKLYRVYAGNKEEFASVTGTLAPKNVTVAAGSQVIFDKIYVIGAPAEAIGNFSIEADITLN